MEIIELNITGLIVTEQSETQHNLYLVTPNHMRGLMLFEKFVGNIRIEFFDNGDNPFSIIVYFLDINSKSTTMSFNKNSISEYDFTILKSNMITHLGVAYWNGEKNIPLLDAHPLLAQ